MTRYIDADALMDELNTEWYADAEKRMQGVGDVISICGMNRAFAVMRLSAAPSADVVEVVRCKDCVNRRTTRCQMYWESDDHKEQYSWENDNEFCSEGCRATAQEGAER